jgi:hypothetical protein
MLERYRHTQPGWVSLVISVAAIAVVLVAGGARREAHIAAAVVAAIALVFSALTVIGDEQGITLRFGPGIVLRRFRWDDIASCRRVRNPALAGWGIRYLGNGWLYNVSGFDAVELGMKSGRRYRIGTDDPDGLERFIRARLG